MDASKTNAWTGRPVAPFAAATVIACLAGAGLCAAFAPEGVRGPVLAGALASFLSGCVALAGIAVGVRRRGPNGLLAGFGVGFLARALAVAIGLLASGAQGRSALLYAASFFGFYAITQAVEIAYVWACSRAQRATVPGLLERSTQ